MNAITKVSEITAQDVAEYLRIPEVTAGDLTEIGVYLEAAKNFVSNYTGLDADAMDTHPDLVMAVLVQTQDFFDNRSAYVDGKNANRAVESILGMHSTNLIPTE